MPRRLLLLSIAQAALLFASGWCARTVRELVASERFGDEVNLVITGGAALALLLVALVAMRRALRKKEWRARLALAVLPVGLLLVCGAFVEASVIDTSVEMEALVEAEQPASPPAAVVLGPGGHDVRLSGELQEGVARRLAALLEAHPDVSRIHLTSEGGLADEGQMIGDVIAAHRLTTFVPDYCVSACTLAFVRGHERLVLDDARLGFHAPYEQGLFGTVYKGDSSDQRDAYLAAGLAPAFVEAALKVDPAGIWYPTLPQLIAARVVTSSVDHYRFPDSNLDGAVTAQGASTLVLHNFPLMNAFLPNAPQALEAIAGWYLDAYRDERSEGEDSAALRIIVRSAVATALARADDATMVDLARFLARAMAVSDSPGACVAIGEGADLSVAMEQLGRVDTNAEAAAVALLRRALGDGPSGRSLPDRGPVLKIATTMPMTPTTCAGLRQAFADLLRQGDAPAIMRALVDVEAQRSLLALQEVRKPHR